MEEHKHAGKLELVRVYLSNGPLVAEVVRSKLESAGIPVLLRSEAQSVFPMTVDGMGQVEVMVAKEHEQAALDLLEQEPEEGQEAEETDGG